MKVLRLAPLLLPLLIAVPLAAQEAHPLQSLRPGERVRVATPGTRERVVGTLVAADAEKVVVTRGVERVERPLVEGSTVLVYRGRDRVLGFLGGAVLGGAGGLVLASTLGGPYEGVDALIDQMAGLTGGALVGGVVGLVHGAPRWQPVYTVTRLSVAPAEGGVALGVSLPLP